MSVFEVRVKDPKKSVSLIVVEWLVLVFTGCPISTESEMHHDKLDRISNLTYQKQ